MKLISKILQPIITIPKGAKIKNTEITCKSQKLLVETGLVRPTSAGFFTLLPLARRALDKLENLVHHHIDAGGAQRISLPSLTSSKLWETSGRLNDIGPELIKVEDRHGKKYLLAPTHEEAISEIISDVGPVSYKQLPLQLYQISNKYRDEHRPKHGLLRAREFCMMDAYTFHPDMESATKTYDNFTESYRSIFKTLDLPVHRGRDAMLHSNHACFSRETTLVCFEEKGKTGIVITSTESETTSYVTGEAAQYNELPGLVRVQAPSGDMGGSLSHEWQLIAAAGEDAIKICSSCSHTTLAEGNSACNKCGKETQHLNSIEVGHTFILGTRYSEPLKANFVEAQGSPQPLTMACYGIGITRLLAASIEALCSDTAMRWPKAIAPYTAMVIGPKEGSNEWAAHDFEKVVELSRRISEAGLGDDVVIDDRHNLTIGKRMMMADKIGYPYIIVCGRSTLESPPRYELYETLPGKALTPQLVTFNELISALIENCRSEKKLCIGV